MECYPLSFFMEKNIYFFSQDSRVQCLHLGVQESRKLWIFNNWVYGLRASICFYCSVHVFKKLNVLMKQEIDITPFHDSYRIKMSQKWNPRLCGKAVILELSNLSPLVVQSNIEGLSPFFSEVSCQMISLVYDGTKLHKRVVSYSLWKKFGVLVYAKLQERKSWDYLREKIRDG